MSIGLASKLKNLMEKYNIITNRLTLYFHNDHKTQFLYIVLEIYLYNYYNSNV